MYGSMQVNLKRQRFCFWHYAALGLGKLHVDDFQGYVKDEHGDLVVRAV